MLLFSIFIAILSWVGYKIFKNWIKNDLMFNIKWTIAYIYLRFHRFNLKPLFKYDYNSKDLGRCGLMMLSEAAILENPRQLRSDVNATDSIAFSVMSNQGDILVIKFSRRHDRCAEVTVYFKLQPGNQEYHLPIQPHDLVYNTDGKRFIGGGLSLEVLEPLRRWRITFNGFLRKGPRTTVDNDADTIPAKFNLIWHPMYDYLAFPQEFVPKAMAHLLAQQRLRQTFCNPNKLFSQKWYDQFGTIIGTLNIAGEKEAELLMRGLKSRKFGLSDWKDVKLKMAITGVLEDGTSFHMHADDANGIENFAYGYILPPCNTKQRHISQWIVKLNSLHHMPDESHLQFIAGDDKKMYNLYLSANDMEQFCTFNGDVCETKTRVYAAVLNCKKGHCIFEVCKNDCVSRHFLKEKSLPILREPESKPCKNLVLALLDNETKCSNITGGKGASIALLASIPDNKMFVLPKSIFLTNTAFEEHLCANPSILEAISSMENVAWNTNNGCLKEECNRLVQLMQSKGLNDTLKVELELALCKTFGADHETQRFAVRSSAIGEDGEELSAAGQNETFLGVQALSHIFEAVIKCWSSQFSLRSIEYKRQNGQLFNRGMGIIIQEMIPADVAGVLFTRNPITDSPSEIMIASNYGLGESVVSATVNPDTIVVSRTSSNRIAIKHKEIGSKEMKIIMSDLGTITSEVCSEEASKCSLPDHLALQLARIAIDLEKRFGSSRDIEWAVNNEQLFLLQVRPVTSENPLTNFEIIHEFDSAPRTDKEIYSTANISEVMPGAVSPLTLSTFIRTYFIQYMAMFKYKGENPDLSVIDTLTLFFGHLVGDLVMQNFSSMENKKSAVTKALEVGIHGRVLDDDNRIIKMAMERFESPSKAVGRSFTKHTLLGILFSNRILRKCQAKYNIQEYCVSLEHAKTSQEAFQTIGTYITDLKEVAQAQTQISIASTVWNLIVLNLLSQGSESYNMDHYSDFATLIGSCNGAESGNVPISIMELSACIEKDVDKLEFQTMDPKKAAVWLNQKTSPAGKKYREFMKRHGHRGFKESDMRMKPFSQETEHLMKILQGMIKVPTECQRFQQSTGTSKDILQKLKTRLTVMQRTLLRFILSSVKTGICHREESKSHTMKIVDGLRRAFMELALRLQHEGFLPDPELIHFLTLDDIDQLMKTRSAKILRRAKKRQSIFPSIDSIVLPEIIYGIPKYIDDTRINECDGVVGLHVTGCPVCQGTVQGKAAVITTFEDADKIQIGDILVIHATDIGWSPYFPMLKGLVTEIGGLISHGAVVAREFGLPCIVGAQNATKLFKTGDIVLLDADNGMVTKVEFSK